MNNRGLILLAQEEFYREKRFSFQTMGEGRIYTSQQKRLVFEMLDQYGIRATSRILKVPRRTIQRWCRKYRIRVKRCPDWVYQWAEKRKRKKEFWRQRGYY